MKIENEFCTAIANVNELGHTEWLAQRTHGIGGSDAGAIMGLNPWKSALMVYLEKIGVAPEIPETEAMKHGKRMEPVLRREFPELYKEVTGIDVTTQDSPFLYKSKKIPFLLGNIDGVVLHPDKKEYGLEVKTANIFAAKEWADNCVPDSYFAQVQHYMYLLGFEKFFIPVLIGNIFEYREVFRNEEFIKEMLTAESWFWHDCYEKKQMPAPAGIANEDDYLLALYGEAGEEIIPVSGAEPDIERYLELNESIKTMEGLKKELQQKFKTTIGNAKGLIAGTHKVTWSRFEQSRFDTSAFKAKHPDIYEQFSRKELASRLTVK